MEERFIQLIKQNEALLYKVVTLYASSKAAQPDLYQEIVLQLWRVYGRYRGDAKVTTWMYRVALNTAITFLRKHKRRQTTLPLDVNLLEHPDWQDTEQEKRVQDLYRHIGQLPPLEKGLILLFLERKSYQEIAQITGLSTSNVGTRLNRIEQKLKQRMHQTV